MSVLSVANQSCVVIGWGGVGWGGVGWGGVGWGGVGWGGVGWGGVGWGGGGWVGGGGMCACVHAIYLSRMSKNKQTRV